MADASDDRERDSILPRKINGPTNYSAIQPNSLGSPGASQIPDHRELIFPTPPQVIVSGGGSQRRVVEGKSLLEAYLLCVLLGFLGFHHFYLRRNGFGLIYLVTGGLMGVGWIVDMVRLPWLVSQANRRIFHPVDEDALRPFSTFDTYLLWFPLGLLGLHHYYLRRLVWGMAYTSTGGLFAIGWLVDAFRIPSLVREANDRFQMELMLSSSESRMRICRGVSLEEAYVFCLPPLGIIGAHHFRMKRYANGIFYCLTGGGCAVGWIIDWFRMKWLVDRANHPERYPLGHRQKFVDDAYIYAFPLGLLGLHHFYLGRPCWGVIYLITGGLLGIGWLFDLYRMPCLVREANERLEAELTLAFMVGVASQWGQPDPNSGNQNLPTADFYFHNSISDSCASFEEIRPVGEADRRILYLDPPPAYDDICHHPSPPPVYGFPPPTPVISSCQVFPRIQ